MWPQSELREEWTKFLQQTQKHVEIMNDLLVKDGVGPAETPGRLIIRFSGNPWCMPRTGPRAAEIRPRWRSSPANASCLRRPRTIRIGRCSQNVRRKRRSRLRAQLPKLVLRSRKRRTNTSITAKAGAANFGSSRSAWRRFCRHPRKAERQIGDRAGHAKQKRKVA